MKTIFYFFKAEKMKMVERTGVCTLAKNCLKLFYENGSFSFNIENGKERERTSLCFSFLKMKMIIKTIFISIIIRGLCFM